jgi:hypothetical protein
LLQNNGKDVRLNENKVSQECETLKVRVLSNKDKFEGFGQKKREKVEYREKKEGLRKK